MSHTHTSYTLIGHPLGHSRSPQIHDALFTKSGICAKYTLRDIPPEALPGALPELLAGNAGINITIPHKQAVIPYLDGVRGMAAMYGSVNTVKNENGRYFGYNTDGEGFLFALKSSGIALQKFAVIAGAGGAGRVFAMEAAAAGCEVLCIGGARAELLAEDTARNFPNRRCFAARDPDAACRILDSEGVTEFLLINATPVGMHPHPDSMPVTVELIMRSSAVFDAVYNPMDTLLLRTAAESGKKTAGGLPMLVAQAAAAHNIWLGLTYSLHDIRGVIDLVAQSL